MRKTVQILFVMLFSCLALFAVDGEVTTPVDKSSDTISVTLEYAPKHEVSFYKDFKQDEMPDGPTGGPIDSEKNKQTRLTLEDSGEYEGYYIRSFYLSGTSNYAINDYPTMTVSWTDLSMVYPEVDKAETISLSVYVHKGRCVDINSEYEGQWVDGKGNTYGFYHNTKDASYVSGNTLTLKGFTTSVENNVLTVAVGEHQFSYELVAAVSADAYEAAKDGQYISTFELNVTGP